MRAHQHDTMRARGEREEMGLWRGTGIQLTGTSFQYHLEGDYPVCKDKRGEGGAHEGQEQRDRQVRGHRQNRTDLLPVQTEKERLGAEQIQTPLKSMKSKDPFTSTESKK